MKVVVKLGHSLIGERIELEKIRHFAALLKKRISEGDKFVVVVGGGAVARAYINASRILGGTESFADNIGIAFTRINCMLLISALGENAYPTPTTSLDELKQALRLYHIVTIGGLTPGHSTDAVAALSAETISADIFIKMIEAGGIYDKDPKVYEDAKLLNEVNYEQLLQLILENKNTKAGEYKPLDLVALEILRRSKIKTVVVGSELENLEAVLRGEEIGTRIKWSDTAK
ncbi:MAG: UMP kinase [Thermoproteota archaeon]|nr:UMP kinase [Candidatus Brockarchaeota archaeon]MBO3762650.1 UMP kinase [Candidatus Brockarchaeota archaeon]MBO3768509.1 UMP kinase [Candidatus Brockarchaeota archaeon]MBO3801407.1 UMP kinase [Candidatus Brockarchaeota archaeon]